MIRKVFSIRDLKSETYNPPFFKTTAGEAERDFQTLVNDEKSMVSQYPEDYDLFCIGEYDDQSGLMIPLQTPNHICKAISLKRPALGLSAKT